MKYIEKFLPAKFDLNNKGLKLLKDYIDKDWKYATNGRASIFHILKANKIKKIFVPIYICETVLEPIIKLNIEVYFYDLDLEDLNPSIESLSNLYTDDIDAVLVASMYGNPANMVAFEDFCSKKNILLIDDAAQSFGARLNGKNIGTFGDAGFFSFSPGKPLAGHLGSFFWLNKEYDFNRSHNKIYHYFKWMCFNYTRVNIYNNIKLISLLYKVINKFMEKLFYSYNDDITEYDKKILGGILYSHFNNKWKFRKKVIDNFKLLNIDNLKLITNIRGISNNHKLVFLAKNRIIANRLKALLKEYKIYYINGYKLLSPLDDFKNARTIDGLVFEIPIEDDDKKMNELYKILENFVD